MPEPLNVSNTLVNQPVNYIGHNPYRWKWIGKWDSEIFLKDFYQNEELGVPQYDLICGEGIVVMDDIEGGQCGQTTTVIEEPPTPDETYKVDIIYFSYYKEPDGWGTMVESQIEYVHKDIVAEKKGDIYEIDVTDSFKKVFNDYCGGSGFRGYFEIYEMGCIYTFPPIHATLHDPQPGYKYSHDVEPCDQIGAAAQIFLFLSNQGTDYTQYFETYLFTHNGNVSAGYASHDYKMSFAVLNPNYNGSYVESELAYNSTNIVAFGNYSENSNFAINLATGGWHMQNAVEYNRTTTVPMTVQDYISGNITQKNLIKMHGLPERLYFAIWKDGDTADKCTIHVRFFNYDTQTPFHTETFESEKNTIFTKKYSYVYLYDLYAKHFTNYGNNSNFWNITSLFNETFENYYDVILHPYNYSGKMGQDGGIINNADGMTNQNDIFYTKRELLDYEYQRLDNLYYFRKIKDGMVIDDFDTVMVVPFVEMMVWIDHELIWIDSNGTTHYDNALEYHYFIGGLGQINDTSEYQPNPNVSMEYAADTDLLLYKGYTIKGQDIVNIIKPLMDKEYVVRTKIEDENEITIDIGLFGNESYTVGYYGLMHGFTFQSRQFTGYNLLYFKDSYINNDFSTHPPTYDAHDYDYYFIPPPSLEPELQEPQPKALDDYYVMQGLQGTRSIHPGEIKLSYAGAKDIRFMKQLVSTGQNYLEIPVMCSLIRLDLSDWDNSLNVGLGESPGYYNNSNTNKCFVIPGAWALCDYSGNVIQLLTKFTEEDFADIPLEGDVEQIFSGRLINIWKSFEVYRNGTYEKVNIPSYFTTYNEMISFYNSIKMHIPKENYSFVMTKSFMAIEFPVR